MMQTTMRLVVNFREQPAREPAKKTAEKMSLSELLYHVLFGDGRMESVQEMHG